MKTHIFKERIISPLPPPSPGRRPHLRRRCTAPDHRRWLGWQDAAGTLGTGRAATAAPRPSRSCRRHLRTPLHLLLLLRTRPCRSSLVVGATAAVAELASLLVAVAAASISGSAAASAWSSPASPPPLGHRRHPHPHPVDHHHPDLPHLRRRPHRSRLCAGPKSCAAAAASGGHLLPPHLRRPYLPLAGSPRWAQLPSCGGGCSSPEVLEGLPPPHLLHLRPHLHPHPSLGGATTVAVIVAGTPEA